MPEAGVRNRGADPEKVEANLQATETDSIVKNSGIEDV
jgi:hypothetical protein